MKKRHRSRSKNPGEGRDPKALYETMLEDGIPGHMALGVVLVALGAKPSTTVSADDLDGCTDCLRRASFRIQDAVREAGYEEDVKAALFSDPAAGMFEVWFIRPEAHPLLQRMLEEEDEAATARLIGAPCFDDGGRWGYALVVGDEELTSWRCDRRSTAEVAAVAEAWSKALKAAGIRVRVAMIEALSPEALLEALSEAIGSGRDLAQDERKSLGRFFLEKDCPRTSADVLSGSSGRDRLRLWRTLLRTVVSGLSDPVGAFDLEEGLYADADLDMPRADCPDDGTRLEECAECGRESYCPTHDFCPFDAPPLHGHGHGHDQGEDDQGEEWRRGAS